MQLLIDRFLAGHTTIEEEERLARYFRETRDIPDEWKPIRDMLAYIDDGMPIGSLPDFDGTRHAAPSHAGGTAVARRTPRRRIALWTGMASVAAAAAVALLVTLRPAADAVQPQAGAAVAANGSAPADTLQTDGAQPAPDAQPTAPAPQTSSPKDGSGRRTVRRHYDMAPPKTYYAAMPKTDGDNAADGSTAERQLDDIVAEQRRIDTERQSIEEEQRRNEQAVKDMLQILGETHSELMANGDFDDDLN